MHAWGARINAALHGEVEGSDVQSLVAAATPPPALRQALADRRLEVELAHLDAAWRVAFDLGSVAAPLWAADAVTVLAGSLLDAEAEAHPATPKLLSMLSHQQALTLLQTAIALIADAGGALADPAWRGTVRLPFTVNLSGQAAAAEGAPPPAYLRGLARGADRLEGMAQSALDELAQLAGRTPAPGWLDAGLQRLRGELAATQTRLAMVQTRGAAVLDGRIPDLAAARDLEGDIWNAINTYLHAGQLSTAPSFLPGAALPAPPIIPTPHQTVPAATHHATGDTPAPQTATPRQAPTPPSPAQFEEPPRTAPPIGTYRPPPAPRPEDAPHALPQIGTPMPAPRAVQAETAPHALPQIGTRPPAPPSPLPAEEAPHALPQIDTAARRTTPEEARSLPQIRGGSPAGTPDRHAGETGQPGTVRTSPAAPASAPHGAAPPVVAPGGTARQLKPAERWILSSPGARHRLRAAGREDEAEAALSAFWQARGWTLSAGTSAYLHEIERLVTAGAISASGRSQDEAPYAPIYRVSIPDASILGRWLTAETLFRFDGATGGLRIVAAHEGLPDV